MLLAPVLVAASAVSARAAVDYLQGQSWTDPSLGEILSTADLVAEVKVVLGGQWRAEVEVVRVLHKRGGAEAGAGDVIVVEGFNSFEWNTSYYALRADESVILALYHVPPDEKSLKIGDARGTWTLPTPSSGRFPLEQGKVVGRFGKSDFLVEIAGDDFRSGLEAYFAPDPKTAARRLAALLLSRALETRYLGVVLLGEVPAGAEDVAAELLGQIARDKNPALRESAAHALASVGGPHAARALVPYIKDADRRVSRSAALALTQANSSAGAAPALVDWLARSTAADPTRLPAAERRPEVQAQGEVFQFLAEGEWAREATGPEREHVTKALLEMVASGRAGVAVVAVRALGRAGAREAVSELVRLLDAEDTSLREEAKSALLMITLSPACARKEAFLEWWKLHGTEPRSAWVASALALVERFLGMQSYDGDMLGGMLIGASRDPRAPWAARSRMAKGEGWSGAPLEEMRGPLVFAFAERMLSAYSSTSRERATEAIGRELERMGGSGRSFAPELLRASWDIESTPRDAALEALGAWGDREAVGRLIEELEYSLASDHKKTAGAALSRLARRHLGYYSNKGYDLTEERRGVERWRTWWHAARSTWRPDRPRAAVPLMKTARAVEVIADGRAQADAWETAARSLASTAGGGVASSERRTALQRLSRSRGPRERAVAAALMGLRAERESSRWPLRLLADGEPSVRIQAAWALGRALRGTADAPEALVEIAAKDIPPPGAEAGPDDPPPTVADPFATGPATFTRRAAGVEQVTALHALGKIGGVKAIECLRTAARSSDGSLAAEAAWALDACAGRAADEALLELVTRDEAHARELAARALARRRPAGTVGTIAGVFRPGDYYQSFALTEALIRAARPRDAGLLAKLIDPMNETGTYAATRALSEHPGPAAAPALIGGLAQGGYSTRFYCVRALMKLGESGGLDPRARAAASDALAERLLDFDTLVSSAAATALEHAGTPSAAPALFQYLGAQDPPNPRAFGAVVRLGGTAGLRLVHARIGGGEWADMYFGLAALRYARPGPAGRGDPALDALVKAWRDPESQFQDVAAKSLRAIGPAAVPSLLRDLREGGPDTRRRAAALLGEIGRGLGGADAWRALVGAVASDDEALAWIADRALARALKTRPLVRLRSRPEERAGAARAWAARLFPGGRPRTSGPHR
ncbi:MAG: HEAT repeat domain-containing protein [Planctomycetota bacterium]|jgi:HEAT repeat protein